MLDTIFYSRSIAKREFTLLSSLIEGTDLEKNIDWCCIDDENNHSAVKICQIDRVPTLLLDDEKWIGYAAIEKISCILGNQDDSPYAGSVKIPLKESTIPKDKTKTSDDKPISTSQPTVPGYSDETFATPFEFAPLLGKDDPGRWGRAPELTKLPVKNGSEAVTTPSMYNMDNLQPPKHSIWSMPQHGDMIYKNILVGSSS